MESSQIHIGCSGFSYKDWLGNFYPQFCPPPDFLTFYSAKFATVEIDSTYYRIPSVETVKKWAKNSCEHFIFCAKFPQAVTHEGDVGARLSSADKFIETMRHLDHKLGVLLLQFPYSFKPEQRDMLIRLLENLPDNLRFSVELRNKAWLTEKAVFELFCQKNIAFCLVDHPWMPKTDTCTADFSYIRFLGDRKLIEDDFSYVRNERKEDLLYWAELMRRHADRGKEIFAFFNNHYSGHAPTTAYDLIELLDS